MFWMLLAVLAFTFFVSPLLQPKIKGPAANLGEVGPPTAERGIPIPVAFGTVKLSPNVVWYGNIHAEEVRTVTGNRTLLNPFAVNHSTVTGHRYGADIAGVICHGPIDELMDIQFQDVSMRKYTADNQNYVMGPGGVPVLTTPLTPGFPQTPPVGNGATIYSLKAPDLFGGDDGEGGVTGQIEFWWGKLTQNLSTLLAGKVGHDVSNYKGIVHFVMYNATFGTSPYIKPFYAIVRRCPQTVSPDAATANINGSANGADVIYEIMTNTRWGLRKSPVDFDIPSFTAAAVTLKAEGMGIDFVANQQDSAEAWISEVQRHIDAVIYSNPLTGKITMKLIRADYVVADLLHVNKSNCTKVDGFRRTTWPETINEVKVNYIDRGSLPAYTFKRDTMQAQNLASQQAMGDIASTTLDFSMFSNSSTALKAAFRSLRAVSIPLASCSLVVNRKLAALMIATPFVLDWEPLGITGLVLRVTNVVLGTLDNNQIELQVVEDVFNTAPVVFVAPPSTSWTPPATIPTAHVRAAAMPAMYYLTRADQFIGLNFVVRSSGASTSWDGLYNNDPTVADSPPTGSILTTGSPFTPAGTLTAIYPYNTAYQDETGFIVQDFGGNDLSKLFSTDAAGLARGDYLAWIASNDGGEIIAWREIIPQATPGQYLIRGVLRGQFDTAPLDHPLGATVYFFWPTLHQSYYPGQDTTTTIPTATAQSAVNAGYKFWPGLTGITSSLPPGLPSAKIAHSATIIPATDPQRAVMPLPVGNLQLNTVKDNVLNPATLLPDTNNLTWVPRNRLLQTAPKLHDAVADSPEAAEVYEVEVRHVSRTTGADIFGVIHTYIGASSPLTYTNEQFELDIKAANGGVKVPDLDARRTGGGVRFLVRSVRGSLKSYDIALPGFRRKQEVGYPIIPSLQFTNIASLLVPAEPPFVERIQQGITVTNT